MYDVKESSSEGEGYVRARRPVADVDDNVGLANVD